MSWLMLVCLAGCLCGGGGALRRPQNPGPQKYEFQVGLVAWRPVWPLWDLNNDSGFCLLWLSTQFAQTEHMQCC